MCYCKRKYNSSRHLMDLMRVGHSWKMMMDLGECAREVATLPLPPLPPQSPDQPSAHTAHATTYSIYKICALHGERPAFGLNVGDTRSYVRAPDFIYMFCCDVFRRLYVAFGVAPVHRECRKTSPVDWKAPNNPRVADSAHRTPP